MFNLQDEWQAVCQTVGADQARARALFTELERAYRGPGRFYHTLDHIQAVLICLEGLRPYASDLPAIQLAAWFHDCVYDPRASDNEEQSALYAAQALTDLALPGELIQKVSRLVLCTKTHEVDAAWPDGQLLLDADLAVLGAPPQTYDAYAQAIRQEYSHVPEEVYARARIEILRAFLRRPRIYLTEPVYAEFEQQARINLRREIAALA
jgi:predicted metal-dependent HD superfamily phosphohydrolase